jgi:hypothetical protein
VTFFKTRRSEYFSNHTQSYFVLLRGEHSIAVYGIISRMLMFALFPILGITQGLFQLLVIITELKIMKGQGKYPNFYQICSASITNFVFILYYATPIVSVLLPIQSYFRDTGCLALGICSFYYCHPINRAAYFQAAEMLRKRCC